MAAKHVAYELRRLIEPVPREEAPGEDGTDDSFLRTKVGRIPEEFFIETPEGVYRVRVKSVNTLVFSKPWYEKELAALPA